MATMIIDFETRSKADLRKTGAYKYAEHKSTEPLCLAYGNSSSDVRLWTIFDKEPPKALFEHIEKGGLVLAHNVFFDRCIWDLVCVPRMGWPQISPKQWRCSMATAKTKALPAALGNAAKTLNLNISKAVEGKMLINKLSKPKKDGSFCELPNLLDALYDYCIQDVGSTIELHKKVGGLTDRELKIWQLDQEINYRGIRVETHVIKDILDVLASVEKSLLEEIQELTEGEIKTAGQRDKILAWAESQGVTLPGYTKEIVDNILKDPSSDLPKKVRRVLEIRQILGKSSTAKYKKMLDRVAKDERVHEVLNYHKAHTGRWAGAGVQLQNLPRPSTSEDPENIIDDFLWGVGTVESKHANPFQAAADILRSVIVSDKGKDFIVADYAAVEARILLWVAGDEEALDIFRRGDCIYCEMASSIYRVPAREIYQKYKAGDFEAGHMRFMGKSAILGLGYQMGAPKFKLTCESVGGAEVSDALAKKVVETYRQRFNKVKKLWDRLEKAAARAVKKPREIFTVGLISFKATENYLLCKLPSGRALHYPRPCLKPVETSWGDLKLSLTYREWVGSAWQDQSTYGGKLAENICQAISRDLVADAMLAVENAGYPVVLSVHDEIGSEVPEGFGSVEEYCHLMCSASPWAKGLPLKAEGWRGKRFRK